MRLSLTTRSRGLEQRPLSSAYGSPLKSPHATFLPQRLALGPVSLDLPEERICFFMMFEWSLKQKSHSFHILREIGFPNGILFSKSAIQAGGLLCGDFG